MADAVAKREARRRRILENSESRLERITGRKNCDESEENFAPHPSATDDRTSVSNFNVSELSANEAVIEKEITDSLIEDINSEEKDQSYDAELEQRLPRRSSPRASYIRDVPSNEDNSDRTSSTDRQASPGRISSERNVDWQSSDALRASKESLISSVLTSRTIYILLAVIANVLLVLKLDYLFGEAIVVPYLVVTLGRLCICENLQDQQESSLLVAALILCNVKPELIYRTKTLLTVFNRIFKDFALYVFSYVLMHTAVLQYSRDPDILHSTRDAATDANPNQNVEL